MVAEWSCELLLFWAAWIEARVCLGACVCCRVQGLGVSDEEEAAYGDLKRKYGDLSGSGRSSGAAAAAGQPGGGTRSAAAAAAAEAVAAAAPPPRAKSGPTAGSGSAGRVPGSSSSSSGGSTAKSTEQYVEDELAALKRKLGMK